MPQDLHAKAIAAFAQAALDKDKPKAPAPVKSGSYKVMEDMAMSAGLGYTPEFEAMSGANKPIKVILQDVFNALKNPKQSSYDLGRSLKGYFLDKDADFYDIGKALHEDTLVDSGLLKLKNPNSMISSEEISLTPTLEKNKLIRLRQQSPNYANVEMAARPTDKQLFTLVDYFQGLPPKNDVFTDFRLGKNYAGGHFTDTKKLIDHLFEFYK